MTNKTYGTYIREALESAKAQELADYYLTHGYSVQREVPEHGVRFDLVAFPPDTRKPIAVEIRTLHTDQPIPVSIEDIRKAAHALGYEFRLVLINPPSQRPTRIVWLNDALLTYLQQHRLALIDDKAPQVSYETVTSYIISLTIDTQGAVAEIDGTLLTLLYQSESSPALSFEFPFQGRVSLDLVNQQVERAEIRVDDSLWLDE